MALQTAPSFVRHYEALSYRANWLRRLEAHCLRSDRTVQSLNLEAPLNHLLDDTPVDSFLANLEDRLFDCEARVFEGISSKLPDEDRTEIETSLFFGRDLAQALRAGAQDYWAFGGGETKDIRGLFEVIRSTLFGLEINGKECLLRRYGEHSLEYDILNCPHCRPEYKTDAARDRACRARSHVVRGLSRSFFPNLEVERGRVGPVCVDRFKIIG